MMEFLYAVLKAIVQAAALLVGAVVVGSTLGPWGLGIGGFVGCAWWWENRKERQAALAAWERENARCWERQEGPHGKAGWAKQEEVQAFGLLTPSRRAMSLGRYIENYGLISAPAQIGAPLGFSGETNIITIGPAGTGKGATAIIPTLLTSHENMFVLDIKGENWAASCRFREEILNHQVVVIDAFNVSGLGLKCDGFNPLESLIVKDGNIPHNFATDINALGEALIVTEGKEPHWSNRARSLVTCLMAHVCSTPGEIPTLPRVREILGLRDEELSAYMLAAAENPIPLVRDNAAKFIAIGSREIDSIISTAMGQLDFLLEPAIIRTLGKSTFKFADMRRRAMTVYFIIPPRELKTYYRFARLVVQSFMNTMSQPPKPGQLPVLAILDEQAQLGHMTILEESAALLRGYKVRIWSVFQDLAQLKHLYKDRWESFLSNAGIQQFFTSNDQTTAEYLSKKIGKCTVPITTSSNSSSFNRSTNKQGEGSSSSISSSTSTALHGIPFMSPQELYGLEKNVAVVLVAGLQFPVRQLKVPYYEDPNLAGRWDNTQFHEGR